MCALGVWAIGEHLAAGRRAWQLKVGQYCRAGVTDMLGDLVGAYRNGAGGRVELARVRVTGAWFLMVTIS